MNLSLQIYLLFEYKKGQLSIQLVLIIVDCCLFSQERGRKDQRFGLGYFHVTLQELYI